MKVCKNCNTEKPVDNFNKKSSTKDKLDTFCKECKRLKANSYYKDNPNQSIKTMERNKIRRNVLCEMIVNYLQLHSCIDCGEQDIRVLEFDHVRGEKKFCISTSPNLIYSEQNVKDEIEKCDIRCRNCHKIKTSKDFNHNYHRWYEQYLKEGKVTYT